MVSDGTSMCCAACYRCRFGSAGDILCCATEKEEIALLMGKHIQDSGKILQTGFGGEIQFVRWGGAVTSPSFNRVMECFQKEPQFSGGFLEGNWMLQRCHQSEMYSFFRIIHSRITAGFYASLRTPKSFIPAGLMFFKGILGNVDYEGCLHLPSVGFSGC